MRNGCLFCLCFLLSTSIALSQDGWPQPTGRALTHTARHTDDPVGKTVQPAVLAKVPLGNMSFYIKGGVEPDTSVAFTPDGKLLAIGTFDGKLIVLDVYAGTIRWQKQIAEGMVKAVAFSADGTRVLYAEQSVDAFVYAANATDGKEVWRFRLADDLKTSAPPPASNPYGMYQLPGGYRVQPLRGGDTLVLGIHSWGDYTKTNGMTRLSRVYRLTAAGKVRWAFPKDAPLPLSIVWMDASSSGERVAFLVGTGAANTPAPPPIAPGSLCVLDGLSGKQTGLHTIAPLTPYFKTVNFWESLSVNPAGDRASVGTMDGRTFLFDLASAKPLHTFTLGTPLLISNVPVSATSSYTHLAADGTAYFQTASSNVPFSHAGQYSVTPPGPHPNANTLYAVNKAGKIIWRYRSGHVFQNLWSSADGRWLLTAVKRDTAATGHDAGAMLFDTHRTGGGAKKLVYYYQVEGHTFFHGAISPDGAALAIVEVPYKDPKTKALIGTYQVHVLR